MQKEAHILVIRLSALGDVAMTVPVIRAFTHQYPNVKITVISKPFLAPLFEDIPNVYFFGAEIKGKHKGVFGLFKLYKTLKKLQITHVADLHNVLRSKILRTYFSFSGYKTAVIDKGRAEKKALTRVHHKVFKPLKTSHERYADVLRNLGFHVDLTKVPSTPKLSLSENIVNITGEKQQSWVGIAPFASFDGKKYPLRLMEKVISEISSKNIKVFLFGGGKEEIEILNKLESTFRNTKSVAGKLSFREELHLISHLDLMISMDSGNAHFSAMQKVKTLTIWGVTHPFAGFAPYGQPADYCILPDLEKFPNIPCSIYGNKVCPGYENVMETIEPSTIVAKVETILSH